MVHTLCERTGFEGSVKSHVTGPRLLVHWTNLKRARQPAEGGLHPFNEGGAGSDELIALGAKLGKCL